MPREDVSHSDVWQIGADGHLPVFSDKRITTAGGAWGMRSGDDVSLRLNNDPEVVVRRFNFLFQFGD